LAPVLAILGGILIKSILNTRIKLIFIFILSGILVYTSIGVIEEKLVVDDTIHRISTKISETIPNDSNFGINYYSPAYINAVGTNGTRIGLNYYEAVPEDEGEEILFWMENGIEHFCLLKSIDSTEEFQPVLDKYGKIIYDDEEILIYRVGI